MTLAILSWAATKTLVNSLESYKKYGLDTLDDDKVIFFQEYTKEDKAIAKDYGYDSIGSPENIGIAEAYKLLVAYASGDLFLFLENDWELIEFPHKQIQDAEFLLQSGVIDVAKFRHRTNPGEPLWSRQYKDNPYSGPHHLLDSVHYMDHPDTDLLGHIRKEGMWYWTEAYWANWTNNPTMFRTEWLREQIIPRMEGDIEIALQTWWQEQDFIVAQSDGLFTHNRLDH